MRRATRCALVAGVLLPVTAQAQTARMQVAARVLEPVGISVGRGATPAAPATSLRLVTRPGAPLTVALSRDLIASGFTVTLATPNTSAPLHRALPGDQRRLVVITHL